jgi:putative N6-adenine-specific DNA methylase
MDRYFAVCAPGLEACTALELQRLGLLPAPAKKAETNPAGPPKREEEPRLGETNRPASIVGGVGFEGDLADLYRANLHLRTASRVLARLGMPFLARDFDELRAKAARLPWERFLAPGQPVALRVTCHKSRLYHSDAVARVLALALADRLGQPSPLVKTDEESDQPPQLIVVRLAEDRVTVSVDSSGTILHKRGYRLASAKAPLRETLAAGLLMASGWDLHSPLLDPFCGSGTIPIEAALMALGIPPGIKRRFAFMDWPGFDQQLWASIQTPFPINHPPFPINHPPSLTILASDRDAGATEMARQNAERAGVADCIEFSCRAVSAVEPPPGPGWVVTNPPYGQRVRGGRDLRDLYARFGDVLREKCPGWQVTVLCSDRALLGQMRLELDTSLALVNGGIRVRVGRGKVTPR